jgi:DNA-binding transcriptional ArsR family regulator
LEVADASTLRALAHPLRVRMLSLLHGQAGSAAELARELGVSQAAASYHLRRLAAAGMVELVEERMHRGGRERRYRRRELRLPRPGPSERLAFMRVVASEAERKLELADLSASATTGDEDIWVARERWDEIVAETRRLLGELDASAVAARTPGAIRVSASVLFFALRPEEPAS